MLRNRRGATSLRWLRALLDHGIEVHGQVVVCPGVNDGAVLDDTLAGVLDRYPELATRGVRAARRQPLHHRGRPCGPTPRPRRPPWSTWSRAGSTIFLDGARAAGSCSRPTSTTCSPGRPFPSLDTLRGPRPARERRRHGRRLRGSLPRAGPTRRAGGPGGFFQSVDGAPAEGYRAPRRRPGTVTLAAPAPTPRSTVLTGEYGARVLGPLVAAVDAGARVVAVAQRLLRRQHRRRRAAHRRRPGPGPGRPARGPPLPAARRLPVRRACSSTGCRPADLPRPVEVVAHRRRRACEAALSRLVSDAADRRRRRAGPTSARAPSSTASSAGGRRSSRSGPGSPGTASCSTPSGPGGSFTVVDTGGWLAGGDALDRQVSAQAERAIAEADVVLLVVDTTVGRDRRGRPGGRACCAGSAKPALVVANKVDADSREADAWAFARLGLGDPITVSALHGRGTGDLLDVVVARLPAPTWTSAGRRTPAADDGGRSSAPSVAIVGRPNVGKSTLFNRLIGDERSIVHDLPGTTRDTIDTVVETADGPLRFVDTAGMRRTGQGGRGRRVLLAGAGPAGHRPGRRRPARHRRHRGRHPPGPAAGRAGRRRRQPDRDRPQQVGAARRRGPGPGAGRGRPTGWRSWPTRRCSRSAPRPASACTSCCPPCGDAIDAYHRRVPTRELNTRDGRGPGRPPVARAAGCSTPPRGRPTRRRSPCSPPRRLPPTYLRYLERRIREHFEFGPDAAQAPGPPAGRLGGQRR